MEKKYILVISLILTIAAGGFTGYFLWRDSYYANYEFSKAALTITRPNWFKYDIVIENKNDHCIITVTFDKDNYHFPMNDDGNPIFERTITLSQSEYDELKRSINEAYKIRPFQKRLSWFSAWHLSTPGIVDYTHVELHIDKKAYSFEYWQFDQAKTNEDIVKLVDLIRWYCLLPDYNDVLIRLGDNNSARLDIIDNYAVCWGWNETEKKHTWVLCHRDWTGYSIIDEDIDNYTVKKDTKKDITYTSIYAIGERGYKAGGRQTHDLSSFSEEDQKIFRELEETKGVMIEKKLAGPNG